MTQTGYVVEKILYIFTISIYVYREPGLTYIYVEQVKFTVQFKGRENQHGDRGAEILNKIAQALKDSAKVESTPTRSGRAMSMIMGPKKKR